MLPLQGMQVQSLVGELKSHVLQGVANKRRKNGERMETVTGFIFLGPKSLRTVTAATKLKDGCSLEEKL